MTGSDAEYESEIPLLDREDMRVTVDDGAPTLELPNGQVIRLRVHVTEWTHDRPNWGENVPMDVEVDYDDFAWWALYPERIDPVGPKTDNDFPRLSIEPEVLNPGDLDD